MKPAHQEFPHRNFQEEVDFLSQIFPSREYHIEVRFQPTNYPQKQADLSDKQYWRYKNQVCIASLQMVQPTVWVV